MIHISKKIMVAFMGLLMLGACGDLTELNDNPNEPIEVPAVNLLTQGQYAHYDGVHSRAYNAEWTLLLVQQWAQNEYTEESRYNVDGNDFDYAIYSSVLNELNEAKNIVNNDPNLSDGARANRVAIIDMMMVQGYQILLEGYGAIPYSEALNPAEFPNPSYDSEEFIWNDLLRRLDEAVGSIDESASSFGSGDLIYGGNMAAWKKFGASLMLRAAMRIVDADQSTASDYIQRAVDHGVFQSNADNAIFVFSSDPNLANPLYIDHELNNRDDFCVTEILVQSLQDMGDPRLQAYADTNLVGNYVGMPYGLTDAEAFALKDQSSRPNDATVRSATSPHVAMDYAEVSFILAEAYQRGILSGDAAAAYADGVRASMNYWGITDDAAIDAYIANNPYDAANWKESIGTQKWLALYMNGPQAWAEQRRLDQPALPVPEAAFRDFIPKRLPYPVSEQIRNADKLSQVTSTPGDMSARLYFDVN